MKKLKLLLIFFGFILGLNGQPVHFAHITDTHIGSQRADEDLIRTVNDINAQPDIDFVVITGDITEFGADKELEQAKSIIDQLNKPWYIIPGNHDSKWSESGNNTFVHVFGSERFSFEKGGFLFVGTASGPDMRMTPGLVPREQIVFLDSVLTHMADPAQPVIFINHYPLDNSLSNWYQIIDLLKKRNIQADLLGHGHANVYSNFEGIPGIMGRSNLRAEKDTGGYNLVTMERDTLFYAERTPGGKTHPAWIKVPLVNHHFQSDTTTWPRPDYSINDKFPQVRTVWEKQDNSGIGTGISKKGKYVVYSNSNGEIVMLNKNSGRTIWTYKTSGKIYSTPAISGKKVVCASTNGTIYGLNLKNGGCQWAYDTPKAIVASPVIDRNSVYIGSSEGIFRSLNLITGKLNWEYNDVRNFVETRPLVYEDKVYFGSWGNTFYALDKYTGKLCWKREKYTNRMLSPAAVWPVAASGKIFIVAPDRHMTALDAQSGQEIWDSGKYTCRESIGISEDQKLVYIKNMNEGNVDAFYTSSATQELAWECKADLGYEIAPSPVVEGGNIIFVPTTDGIVCAIDKTTHQLIWKHKVSNALINSILPLDSSHLLLSIFDGKIICLEY